MLTGEGIVPCPGLNGEIGVGAGAVRSHTQLLRRFYDDLVFCGSWNIHFRPHLFKNLVYKNSNTSIFGNVDNALMHSIFVEFPYDFD
jgi:hypothetical protein